MFAGASPLPGANRGTSADSDGVKAASPTPETAASSTIDHSGGRPANSMAAKPAWAAQRVRSAASMTLRLPSRSPRTPPTSSISTSGRIRAVITSPSSVPPPPLPSTAKAVATEAIELPSMDVA